MCYFTLYQIFTRVMFNCYTISINIGQWKQTSLLCENVKEGEKFISLIANQRTRNWLTFFRNYFKYIIGKILLYAKDYFITLCQGLLF